MDQNQSKSVWLRLVLPICLGVFATAIYYNAIKTQKATVTAFVTKQILKADTKIDLKDWEKSFACQPVVFHKESKQSIKISFDADTLMKTHGEGALIVRRDIAQGEAVSVNDFEKPKKSVN